MYIRTMTYTDYDGNERTETFYFNMSKAECLDMQLIAEGGLENYIQSIIDERDNAELVKFFKDVILKSVGKKSPDGRRFIKSEEYTREFSQTEAYSDLYVELATNTEEAIKFFNNIIPKVEEPKK